MERWGAWAAACPCPPSRSKPPAHCGPHHDRPCPQPRLGHRAQATPTSAALNLNDCSASSARRTRRTRSTSNIYPIGLGIKILAAIRTACKRHGLGGRMSVGPPAGLWRYSAAHGDYRSLGMDLSDATAASVSTGACTAWCLHIT
jgi:hypothetical protein